MDTARSKSPNPSYTSLNRPDQYVSPYQQSLAARSSVISSSSQQPQRHSTIPLQAVQPTPSNIGSTTSASGFQQNNVLNVPKAESKSKTPYFLYTATLVQLVMLIYSMIFNFQETGEAIQTSPVFNVMIGPSSETLIKLGARYAPCMKEGLEAYLVPSVQDVCRFDGNNNQWFRFIIPIFLHGGVVHFVINMFVQSSTGFDLEKDWGFVRMFFIYMIGGIGGNIFSVLFSGSLPSVGASGALYGLLACILVDLLQNWKFIKRPRTELVKVTFIIIIALLVGTLPHIDNFAHIGGFIFGLLACLVFIPAENSALVWARRIVVGIGLMALSAGLLYVFYSDQKDFCPSCKYLNCIPGMSWCEEKWATLS